MRRSLPAEEEARRLEFYRQGLTDKQLARAVGMSHQAISHWRWRRGLKPNKDATVDPRRLKMFHAGLTDEEMARREGASPITIQLWRRKRGLRRKKRPKILPPFRGTRTERERLIIEAFERDLLRAADRFEKRAPDIGSFLEAWRDDRASEVIEMIERGDLT